MSRFDARRRGEVTDHVYVGAMTRALLQGGAPVEGTLGTTALHEAAWGGRAGSVRHLFARGADPTLRDPSFHSTPLGWCEHEHENRGESPGHDEVEAVLGSLTGP